MDSLPGHDFNASVSPATFSSKKSREVCRQQSLCLFQWGMIYIRPRNQSQHELEPIVLGMKSGQTLIANLM